MVLKNWWTWWDETRFHIVPAFLGFGISGLNLAETGHSSLHVNKKLWLSAATSYKTVNTKVSSTTQQGQVEKA